MLVYSRVEGAWQRSRKPNNIGDSTYKAAIVEEASARSTAPSSTLPAAGDARVVDTTSSQLKASQQTDVAVELQPVRQKKLATESIEGSGKSVSQEHDLPHKPSQSHEPLESKEDATSVQSESIRAEKSASNTYLEELDKVCALLLAVHVVYSLSWDSGGV